MHDSERKTCLGSGRAKIDCRRARGFREGKGCRDQIMTLWHTEANYGSVWSNGVEGTSGGVPTRGLQEWSVRLRLENI